MPTAANSINEPTTGIVGMTGTGFTASPTTPFLVQIGGTNSYELDEVAIGTSGQVLTSNGAGLAPTFQAAPGGGILTVTGQLTSAQIKALHGTPITIVAAQGVGKVIGILRGYMSFVYGGSNVFVAAASQTVNFYWGTTTTISTGIGNAGLVGTAGVTSIQTPSFNAYATTGAENLAITAYNPIVTEITGNAANNNVINYTLHYIVYDV